MQRGKRQLGRQDKPPAHPKNRHEQIPCQPGRNGCARQRTDDRVDVKLKDKQRVDQRDQQRHQHGKGDAAGHALRHVGADNGRETAEQRKALKRKIKDADLDGKQAAQADEDDRRRQAHGQV